MKTLIEILDEHEKDLEATNPKIKLDTWTGPKQAYKQTHWIGRRAEFDTLKALLRENGII